MKTTFKPGTLLYENRAYPHPAIGIIVREVGLSNGEVQSAVYQCFWFGDHFNRFTSNSHSVLERVVEDAEKLIKNLS